MNDIERAYDFGCGEMGAAFVEGFEPRANFYKQSLLALRAQQEHEVPQPLIPADSEQGQWGKCPKCHKVNRYEYNYCANCGIRICAPEESDG